MSEYNWIATNVFSVSEFLSPHECQEWIRRGEEQGFDCAPINSFLGTIVRTDIRNNERVMVDDHDAAAMLWKRAKDFVPLRWGVHTAVGLNERFRLYRYSPGQFFEWHRDGSFERTDGQRSRLTVLIYLNGGFSGGETSFQDLDVAPDRVTSVVPQPGLALFFEHPLLHKGEVVHAGRKYVLRTDVMFA
jgi:prolyl 4-hydroxylase